MNWKGSSDPAKARVGIIAIVLPPILTVIVFAATVQFVIFPAFKNSLLQGEKDSLKEVTAVVWSMLDDYDALVERGEMSLDEAQHHLLSDIQSLRYGRDLADYFWVMSLDYEMLAHPYRTDLVGTNLRDYRDPTGLTVFQAIVTALERKQEGYLEYTWQRNGERGNEVEKIGYFRVFEPWGWVIGTGAYKSELAAQIDRAQAAFAKSLLAVFVTVVALCFIGVYLSGRSVQARNQAVAGLAESQWRLKLLADHTSDWVFWLGEDGTMVYTSPSCKELTGYDQSDFYGNPNLLQESIHPDDFARWDDHLRHQSSGQEPAAEEFRLKRKDGELIWISHSCAQVCDEHGEFLGVTSSNKDITVRKEAETALANRNAELAEANLQLIERNKALDDFTYMASHDLQEPLRKLLAFRDILLEDLGDDLPPSAREDLGFIASSVDQMQRLINGLLALSRTGRQDCQRVPVSLRECAEKAIENLASGIQACGARVTGLDRLPVVEGDSLLLVQLYQNLIGNALKFSRDDVPCVELTCEQNGEAPVFGVRDNGIGIDPEYRELVFQPFRRLHGRDSFEGSGIGLTICQRVVTRHGGEIWVESEAGKGAHFRFTLGRTTQDE